jgi:FkbM family methyltransferase
MTIAENEPADRSPLWVRAARWALVVGLTVLAAPNARCAETAAAATRRLPRAIWAHDPLVTAVRQGISFELDLRDNVSRTLYFTRWYERRYLTLLMNEARRGDVFVDVGAHIGIHALLVARRLQHLGGGSVVAFEPSPDLASNLSRAVARNHIPNVTIAAVGLGATAGSLKLYSDPERFDAWDTAVRSRVGPGPLAAHAQVTTFDAWRRDRHLKRVDIVKIDVEGDEVAVLQGMRDTLALMRPRVIGVEIRAYILERAGVSEAQVRVELESSGYESVHTPDLEGNFVFRPSGIGG